MAENYRDELSHHGIKGMKWGVWNDETRARRLGRATRKMNKSLDKARQMPKGSKQEAAYLKKAAKPINKYLRKASLKDPNIPKKDKADMEVIARGEKILKQANIVGMLGGAGASAAYLAANRHYIDAGRETAEKLADRYVSKSYKR